jgi:hypothetical protein
MKPTIDEMIKYMRGRSAVEGPLVQTAFSRQILTQEKKISTKVVPNKAVEFLLIFR